MTDDYLLDDLERSQLDATRRRRSQRSRRYQRLVLVTLGFVALVVLATPSIISQTGIARSLFRSAAERYGWTAEAESINVGWITPLSIYNVKLTGPSQETVLEIEQADTALTVSSLIRFDPSTVGDVSLRGVSLHATVEPGRSSVETDLSGFLEPQAETDSIVQAWVHLHDVSAKITDRVDGQAWVLDQSNVNLEIDGQRLKADLAGVVHEPGGHGGAIQSKLNLAPEDDQTAWQLSIDTDSFPLSVTNLIARRYGETLGAFAQSYSGDTTGKMTIRGMVDGSVQAGLGDVRIRNLKAASNRAAIAEWNNALATLDGQVSLAQDRLIGRGLEITTDFASATLDGAFPTTISLVGIDDNPLQWLQALEGTAELDVDLAALNQALPGLIPLRDNATLVSGRVRGSIKNSPATDAAGGGPMRRSELTIQSNSLRARSAGRVVVIDPIQLNATVSNRSGTLTAEQFDLSSSFASASGSGSLESGTANVNVDFGRLYTMLRPVVDLSELSLGGSAGGDVRWTVSPTDGSDNGRWELTGSGDAKNLLVTLPGGYRFERSVVQCDLSAVGQWDGRTLHELSSGHVGVRSGGIAVTAQLITPVVRPNSDATYPIRFETDGRLENLNETLRPWLPADLVSAQGRASGWVIARVGRSRGTITKAEFVLGQPTVNFANRWYSQPRLQLAFDGVLDWPSGNFRSQETTIIGQDISLAVRGEASREQTRLEVAWDADLAGLQNSIGSTIARAAAKPSVRPISFRAVRQESYQFEGDCKGTVTITDGADGDWQIDTSASVSRLSIFAPQTQQIVPPGTPRRNVSVVSPGDFAAAQQNLPAKPLWYEPRLMVEGPVRVDSTRGAVLLPGLQVSCDWFAGSLAGKVVVSDDGWQADLKGPSRLQMETVAQRLSAFLGTDVRAQGIHEAPLSMRFSGGPAAPVSLVVQGELGWDECEVGGFRFGRSVLPVRISESDVKIARSSVPILAAGTGASGNDATMGQAYFAATVAYAETPTAIRIEPGSRIDSLRVTPETASGWLQYLAPLAADATRIEGDLDVEIDKAEIVVGDIDATEVQGSLNVRSMQLASGPLTDQMIRGVKQIKSLVELAGGTAEPASARTLIEMPPQTVEFSFVNSIASHQRMYFQVDRAQLVTSGRVSTNTQIDLVALVPLDARWLGSDLQGLAGQTLTFPITGTLSRPRLDDSAIRNVVSQLGAKATNEVIQNRLDGLLQKQFESGMEQLNSGLEKILPF